MRGYVDFHSHILPCVDDGSDSVETSVQMLEQSWAQGVRRVFATPHFYAKQDNLKTFLSRRDEAEQRLRDAIKGRNDVPELGVGAEVSYFHGMSESDMLHELTLSDTQCILIEMPLRTWTDDMYKELEQIGCRQGITPIVAHVERYLGVFSDRPVRQQLQKLPVLVQANAGFFLHGRAGRAMKLLEREEIHLLGSDCHDLRNRKPNIGGAVERIEKKMGQSALERLQAIGAWVLKGGDADLWGPGGDESGTASNVQTFD